MRDYRFLAPVSLIAGLTLAGCASMSSGEGTTEETKPSEETRKTPAPAEKKTVASEEKAPAARSSRESDERSAPATREEKRAPEANSPERLIAQLNDATREIASLRAANAKLKAAPPPVETKVREPDPADAKLAAGVKSYTQFKNDLATMFADIEKLRAENASLSAQVKEASSGSKDVKSTIAKLERETKSDKETLSKLESELKAEKAARVQAEQSAAKLREQLRVVASAISGLEPAAASGESRARSSSSSSTSSATSGARRHVIKDGETLERLADRYYGDPAKWRAILEANRDRLPLDGTLPSGLELLIPAK